MSAIGTLRTCGGGARAGTRAGARAGAGALVVAGGAAVFAFAVDRSARRQFRAALKTILSMGKRWCLGWFMLAATLIPVADAVIVLHEGGSRTVAFGVHGGTAVAMLIISGLLLIH